MRLLIKLAMSACLLCAMCGTALVRAERPLADSHSPQLLSQEQGRALVDLAISHKSEFRPKPDCSHLVHKIYSLGGLNYDYAGSRDIYHGAEGFERVSTPQPGDLIVWLGHVGIVVAPREKTFFSSVRSGVITEFWTADYWQRRGRPRFYRYRISDATDPILLAAMTQQIPASIETEDVSMTRTAPGSSVMRSVQRPSSTTTAKNAAMAGANTVKPLSNTATSTGLVSDRQPPLSAARPSLATPLTVAPSEPPALVALIRQRGKPSKDDVFVAFTQSGTVRAQKLIAGQQLDMTRPVSVVAEIEVQKIKLKNDVGTIQLKLIEAVSLEGGKVIVDKTITRELCLYRRGDAWVICDSQERFYIPQEQALHAFERQAEIFLQQSPGAGSTRAVVKALDILFDRDEAIRQRAALK